MAKGSAPAAQPTQTTTSQPSPQAKKLMNMAMPFATEFAQAGGPTLPDYSLVQGFDPLQTQGQEMVLGSTGAQGDIVGKAGQGNQFLSSGDVLRPDSNPALQATIDASVRPVYQNLMETVLPKIRGGAIASGNWGGSRQGIAEGLAIGRAGQTAADTAAKVATSGYTAGLDAMGKGQAIAPTIAQSQTLPGQSTSAVGDTRQALAQAMLGEQGQRHSYEQTLPLLMAKELMGLASGAPGGTVTSTANTPANTTPQWMQMAGLGVAGASAASNLLPLLAMSDPGAKQNVEKIGALFDGTPVYRYNYLMWDKTHIGIMADEVAPEAVVTLNGVKFVDHKKATDAAAEIGKQMELFR